MTTLLDPPLAPDARPIEVRGAIVDAIERLAEPMGGGRRVLPHGRLDVVVLAVTEDEQAALRAVLAPLRETVCVRLRELRCDWPSGFDIGVQYVANTPPDWYAGQRFSVAPGRQDPAAASRQSPPELRLTVVRGRTAETSYTLTERRIGIGRSAAPVDESGRTRRNHVAFLEDDGDGHSRTVGRAHAAIRYDPEHRTYQLFDEGSRNGTRVIRDGSTLELIPRDPVGLTIRAGDELQFGTTALRVEISQP